MRDRQHRLGVGDHCGWFSARAAQPLEFCSFLSAQRAQRVLLASTHLGTSSDLVRPSVYVDRPSYGNHRRK